MCGIVGYLGPKKAVPILVNGLEKLEYRGYDSSGVATIGTGSFEVFRSEGKLENLKNVLRENEKLNGEVGEDAGVTTIGIGHTRWATHGKPSETNAHPHVAGDICVVHNGIIENFSILREKLEKEGCSIVSETDSEIAAHLINAHLQEKGDLFQAVKAAIAELEGSYALVVMSLKDPNKLIVAKNATPVILGVSEGEAYVASDIPAILDYTRKVIILEDGDLAEVTLDDIKVEFNGTETKREVTNISWDPITAEKGGFKHFMLKEIYEQPQTVAETFGGRIDKHTGKVTLTDVNISDEDFKKINRISAVACGTAWHAALVMKFYIEKYAGIPVEVDYGSEYRYRPQLGDENTLFIAVSQSGETADTLGSLNLANESGCKTLAICNVVSSSIARKAGNVLYTHAGPEISVASTKAFTAQVTAAFVLALRMGQARGTITEEESKQAIEELVHLPAHITKAIEFDKELEKVGRKYGKAEHFMFLGRGSLYPIALEGALKLKEISYLHAEGYPAGEMKHGPISLITEETPVLVVFGHDGVNYEKAMSNLKEVESRGGRIIAITDYAEPVLKDLAWETIEVGKVPASMLPIVLTIPLQLFAYHVAVYKGTDVDQPRNLAKSVTVE